MEESPNNWRDNNLHSTGSSGLWSIWNMNFDKDERVLNIKYNSLRNKIDTCKWQLEEMEINEAKITANTKKITELENKIKDLEIRFFFTVIDRYLNHSHFDELDIELEKEFRELNQ